MTPILTWFLGLVSRTWIPSSQLTCEEQVVSWGADLNLLWQFLRSLIGATSWKFTQRRWRPECWEQSRNFCFSLWCLGSQLKLFLGSLRTKLMVANTSTFSGYRGSVFQGVAFRVSPSILVLEPWACQANGAKCEPALPFELCWQLLVLLSRASTFHVCAQQDFLEVRERLNAVQAQWSIALMK